jgi:hypothetical protein
VRAVAGAASGACIAIAIAPSVAPLNGRTPVSASQIEAQSAYWSLFFDAGSPTSCSCAM